MARFLKLGSSGAVCCCLLLIAGCKPTTPTPQLRVDSIIVKQQATHETLYLTGVIEPLTVVSVTAPFDGVISQQTFEYGALVQAKQLLLTLDSVQFNESYQAALSSYAKAKRDYAVYKDKMRGTEELKRLGIISNNEYMNEKNQFDDSTLTVAQTTHQLQSLLQKVDAHFNANALTPNDINSSMQLLQTGHPHISIYAPSAGLALLPTTTTSSDDTNKTLQVGTQVKAGQVLLTIGAIDGIALSAKINELHINDIKPGQLALISSNAFTEILTGRVSHVDQQATQAANDSTPTFNIKIIVPTITPAQRNFIHIGMSAKIELQIIKPSTIRVPITAVITDNGQSRVLLRDKITRQLKTQAVSTGVTTLDSVVITQGLVPGNEVMIDADRAATAG